MGIINMEDAFVHLKSEGNMYASTDRFSESDYTLSFFHLTDYKQSHPDHWELHTDGDELIFLLEGKIQAEYITIPDSKLRPNSSKNTAQLTVKQGQAIIIPKGFWHRLLMVEESKIIVITKIEGTQHSAVPQSAANPTKN